METHAVSLQVFQPCSIGTNTDLAANQFRDLMIASGKYPGNLPRNLVPCSDMAGEVIAVGEGVKEWKAGGRVAASFLQDKLHNDSSGEQGLGGSVQGVLTEYRAFPAQVRLAVQFCLR